MAKPREIATVLAAALIAAAVAGLYAVVIERQDGPHDLTDPRPLVVLSSILAAASAAVGAAALPDPRRRSASAGLATGLLIGWGWAGIFSIGLPLVVAGLLVGTTISRPASGLAGIAAGVLAVAVGLVLS